MKKSLLATLIITSLGTVSNHALADLEQKPLTAKEVKQPAKVIIHEGVTSIKSRDKSTYENQKKDVEFIQSELSACAGDAVCEVESVDKLINAFGTFSGELQEVSDEYIVMNNKTIKPEIASQKATFINNLTVLKDDVSALHKRKEKLDELSRLGKNLKEDDKVTVVRLQTELKVGKAKFLSSFNQLSPGLHTITVRDSNLCSITKSIEVKEFPAPVSSFISDTVCLGKPTILLDNSTLSYGSVTNWNWGTPVNSSSQNTTHTFAASGTFPLNLSTISDSGCIHDTALNVVINPLPIIDFNFDPTSVFTFDTKVCFSNLSVGALNYLWNFDFIGPNGTSTLNSPCTVTFPEENENIYRIKLIGINELGCVDSITKNLTIKEDFIINIPNSFTPNGDIHNQKLVVQGHQIFEYNLKIFDRWGELIFESNAINDSWDGTKNGVDSQIGVYVYIVNSTDIQGNRHTKRGHVTLIR